MQCKLRYADTAHLTEYQNRLGETVRAPKSMIVQLDMDTLCALLHVTMLACGQTTDARVVDLGKHLDKLCEEIIATVADADTKDVIAAATKLVNHK